MRPTWDDVFVGQAELLAKRSTCCRAQVGCVIVRDNRPISMGYNGSVSGSKHCDEFDDKCQMVNGRCCTSIHAEINAIINSAANGTSVAGAIAYTTHSPCWECLKVLLQAQIQEIVFVNKYRLFDDIIALANAHGFKLNMRQVNNDTRLDSSKPNS